MKNLNAIFILAFLFILACDNAEEESPTIDIAAPVSVMPLKKASLSRHTTATGNAMAEKTMEVTAPIGGKYKLNNHPVHGRPFKLGDRVAAGQAFVEIEDREYVNSIDLKSAEMNLQISEQEYEKQKSVFEKGGVTQRELRNAELQLTQAQNSLEKCPNSAWRN